MFAIAGCGGLIAPDSDRPEAGVLAVVLDAGAGADASLPDGAFPDGAWRDANNGRGPAPIPVCHGGLSMCIPNPDAAGVQWIGAAIIKCDGPQFQGPWVLSLQRQIVNAWRVVQVVAIDKPGFGVEFDDTKAPYSQLVYRVCVIDDLGERCADPIDVMPAPNCGCVPLTCDEIQACNVTTRNGCGDRMACGDCKNGNACDPLRHTCCPMGLEPDGTGGCVCAPNVACYPPKAWDPSCCCCALPMVPVE
jgi:hypothetical protein